MLTTVKAPAGTFQSIRSVLTENQVAGLIDLRENTSSIQWQAGDLVNEICIQVMAHSLQASIMDVCYFISDEIYGLFAPQTLRIYAAVAKFYPAYARTSIMPFWLYRYATRFEKDWIKVFTWAEDFADTHARSPYEREVRANFEQFPTPTPAPKETEVPSYNTLSPEVEAIEQAALTRESKLTLKIIIRGLLSLIPVTIDELKNPEASRLLSQIAVLSRQLLEQFL